MNDIIFTECNSIFCSDVDNFSFRQVINDFEFYPPHIRSYIVSSLYSSSIKKLFAQELYVSPSPSDLFVASLSELRDTGDIDALVRALNWQHNDISFLSSQLDGYERTLVKMDKLRQECARLRDSANKLRERNSALIQALKESNSPIPKSTTMKKKVRVKPPKPRL